MNFFKKVPWFIWLSVGLLIGAWAEWAYISSWNVFWDIFERFQILFSGILALSGAGILWRIHRSDHENKVLGVSSALAAELYSNRRLLLSLQTGNNIKHLIDSVMNGSGNINAIQDTLYKSLGHNFGLLPTYTSKLVTAAYTDSKSIFDSSFVNAKQVLEQWNEPISVDIEVTREQYIKNGFEHAVGEIDIAIKALHFLLKDPLPKEVMENAKIFEEKHDIKYD